LRRPRRADGRRIEDDYYECRECGLKFGIDWFYDGPPQKPCRPISAEQAEERRRKAARTSRNANSLHALRRQAEARP
jgi:hypothetical protein